MGTALKMHSPIQDGCSRFHFISSSLGSFREAALQAIVATEMEKGIALTSHTSHTFVAIYSIDTFASEFI